jgi:hypothetical protein
MSKKAKTKPPAPRTERVKAGGDWAASIRKALEERKRSAGGWPEPRKKRPD